MNLIGAGADIEKIHRFKRINQKKHHNFLNKIYTKSEIDYCFQNINISERLAAIFSGKEAIIKALSDIGFINAHRNKIRIITNNYNGYDAILPYERLIVKLDISVSEDCAIAYSIIFNNYV